MTERYPNLYQIKAGLLTKVMSYSATAAITGPGFPVICLAQEGDSQARI